MQDEVKAQAIVSDYRSAALSIRERALLEYAVKLSREPAHMARADVEGLHTAGLTDSEILDACQVTAYYAFANRLVDGLGVELEPYWDRAD